MGVSLKNHIIAYVSLSVVDAMSQIDNNAKGVFL